MTRILRAEAVTKAFGGLIAVNSVDLEIEAGQILGLIGPNGAGKTTFFNCITGLYHVTSGQIFFRGENITRLPSPAIVRLGISRTFQKLRIFRGLSVLDNVMIGAHIHGKAGALAALLNLPATRDEEKKLRERAMQYLDLLGLAGKADQLARNLSYGDQRRVEVARALAAEPELILLDEPSAGMNLREAGDLARFIKWIRDDLKKTILLIEHNMRVVMPIADHVVVLNQGEKIFEGTPNEVQNNPDVIAAYLGRAYLKEAERSKIRA